MNIDGDISLKELQQLFKDIRLPMTCYYGHSNSCGCGFIHEIMYICKLHYELMKSNSNISMDNSFPIEDNKTFDDVGSS